MRIRFFGRPAVLTIALLAAFAHTSAQQSGQKKEFAFRGKVEQVDAAANRITVTNEPIEGWMGSMTMAFKVSNEEVIPRLKPGDQISAKVYAGDLTLYDVTVVAPSTAPSAQARNAPPAPGAPADLLRGALARPALDRKQFEDLALVNNPTLKQAAAVLQRSAAQARQAGLYPNPSFGYQGEQIRGGDFRGGEQGAFIQQTIPLGGKLGLRRNVFEQQRRGDEIGATEQRYRVLSEIGQSFYSALAALQTAKLRQQLLALALDAVQTAHQLSNVGQADAPDVLQAEVEAEQAQVDYIAAQRAYIRGFRTLAAITGKPDLPLAPLAGDLEAPPPIPDDIVEQMLRDSPSVKRAQQETLRAQAEVKSARREAVPDLQLRGGLEQNFEPVDPGMSRAVGLQGFASIGITLPIFNRNQGNVQAAKAEVEHAQAEVARVQLSLRQSAEPLVQAILTDQQQAVRYKEEMLPRATRAYQLYLAKYRQMGAAYPQVIVSQRTLFQLQVAYIRVLEDLWRNTIALQNFTLSGALEAPPSSGNPSTTLNLPGSGGSGQ
ncbi:MAG TPA: TolC family protein [Terriglobales bacterium]|nr:TolC family protein [Terriglobales bacterium]